MLNANSTQSHYVVRNSPRLVSHPREKVLRIDNVALDYEGAPQPDEDFADYISPRTLKGVHLA